MSVVIAIGFVILIAVVMAYVEERQTDQLDEPIIDLTDDLADWNWPSRG